MLITLTQFLEFLPSLFLLIGFVLAMGVLKQKQTGHGKDITELQVENKDRKKELDKESDERKKELDKTVLFYRAEVEKHMSEQKTELMTVVNEKLADSQKLELMMEAVKSELKDYVIKSVQEAEKLKTTQEQMKELRHDFNSIKQEVQLVRETQAVQTSALEQLVKFGEQQEIRAQHRESLLEEVLRKG